MNLIFSRNNSIEPRGAIGIQKCGIIFWQKTSFFRHCNKRKFQSIITFIDSKFKPTLIRLYEYTCFIQFDNDDEKIIYVTLKKKGNHYFIYGEAHTVYAGVDFHLFALNIVSSIAKQMGCNFYVDDATEYLNHRSIEKLKHYVENAELKPVVSDDLLRKAIIERNQKR